MSRAEITGTSLGGRYRLDEPIERSGRTTSYRAWDERLERRVVAVLPDLVDPALDGSFDEFRERTRGLLGLSHPHLERTLEAGAEEGRPFAICEAVEGESLGRRLGEAGRQTSAEILAWLGPVTRALDHLHGTGLSHGGVSPDRVVFDDKGNVCLCGLAISGGRGDAEADRYALASLVYLAVTGEAPGPLDSYQVVVSALAGRLPVPATRVLGRALSPDSSERYPSCDEFARALEAALEERAPFFGDEDSGAWFMDRVIRGAMTSLPAHGAGGRSGRRDSRVAAGTRRRASLAVFVVLLVLVAGGLSYAVWVTGDSGLEAAVRVTISGARNLAERGEYAGAITRLDRFLESHPADPALDPVWRERDLLVEARRDAHLRALEEGNVLLDRAVTVEDCGGALARLREADRILPTTESAEAVERALSRKREAEAVAARDAGKEALLEAWNATEAGDLEGAVAAYRRAAHELAAFGTEGLAERMATELESQIARFDDALAKARAFAEEMDRNEEALAALETARTLWPVGYERRGGAALRSRIEERVAAKDRREREAIHARCLAAAREAEGAGRIGEAEAAYREALAALETEEARSGLDRCVASARYAAKLAEGASHMEEGVWSAAAEAYSEAERIAVAAGISSEAAASRGAKAVRLRDAEKTKRAGRAYAVCVAEAEALLEAGAWNEAERAFSEALTLAAAAGQPKNRARAGHALAARELRLSEIYDPSTRKRFERLVESADWKAAEPCANAQGMLEAVHEPSGIVFVLVPAGTYSMGSAKGGDEGPAHLVEVRAFLLARTECTRDAWERVGGNDPSVFVADGKLPVQRITWSEAGEWCERSGLRLPSESEWEYACRAGTETEFATGDEASSLGGAANVADARLAEAPVEVPDREPPFVCTTEISDGHSGPAPVGSFRPNAWGLSDMHGNVAEWCADLYHRSYRGAPGDSSAWCDGKALTRIIRGGSWADPAGAARSANRSWGSTRLRFPEVGFRPAADLPE